MPDLEFLNHIQPSVSHSSKPALVLTGLDLLADIERAGTTKVVCGPHGRVLMEKMLSTAAALDWAMSEQRRWRISPLSDFRPSRAISTAATSAILNLKDLYDAIPIILNGHIASKRNQICGLSTPSLEKLMNDLTGRSGKLLPPMVVKELRVLAQTFSILRNIRTDLTHYGGFLSPRVDGDHLLLWPLKYERKHGLVNLLTRNAENMDAPSGFVLKPLVINALAKWLAFWRNVRGACHEAAEQASVVPRFGQFVLASDYVGLLHEDFVEYGLAEGLEFIWPCGRECLGAIGGCPNNAGSVEAYRRETAVSPNTALQRTLLTSRR